MDALDPLAPFPVIPEEDRYGDRETSQLSFNARVLAHALDDSIPILERVKFCAIYSGNTDEWVQKRLDLFTQDIEAERDPVKRRTIEEQLATIRRILSEVGIRQVRIYEEVLKPTLAKEGVHIVGIDGLTTEEVDYCHDVFIRTMFPVLTPLAIDPGRPFPHISTLSTNIAVRLDAGNGEPSLARVKIPHQLKRFIPLPSSEGTLRFIPTEDVIAANLRDLFPGVEILEMGLFRVTRHAHQRFDEEEADDLLETIESGLLERRFGRVVRIEAAADCPTELLAAFVDELAVNPDSVITVPGRLNLSGLWQIAGLDIPRLLNPVYKPITPKELGAGEEMWARIRSSDIIVQHPYESFADSTLAFIEQAADDPAVVAIKLTIYRTTETDSPVVAALIRAAEAGKQTVALVELKARFDEEANIRRARNLESAGVHVVYGLIGLKTHTKTCLVVREEHGRLRRYCHVGTGNYNPTTANIYEDLGVFTARPEIGEDLSTLFNMLTGYSSSANYNSLLVAPKTMRSGLLERIAKQRDRGSDGYITIKVNNLADREFIDALYEASQAGTRVDLIVRSMCSIVPGRPGLSENITVRSIVGRYLEHSRIFRFGHPGTDDVEYLIGSADMMGRNLNRRVEAIVPVTDRRNQARLEEIFTVIAADDFSSWELGSDGRWVRNSGENKTESHRVLQKLAVRRNRR